MILALVVACASRDAPARDAGPREARADAAPDVAHPAKLRAIQVTRLPGADPAFLLSDPYRYTEKTAVLSGPGYYAATLFDGRRTPGEVALEVELVAGVRGGADDVRVLAVRLERARLLDSARFRAEKAAVDDRWNEARRRPLFHFGRELPGEPAALAKMLDGFYRGLAPVAPGRKRVVAAIAPHIDPRAGGAVYAAAHRTIAAEAADADLFVLLGTGHQPLVGSVGLTRKDYETPFGVLETDREALDFVSGALGDRAFDDEWAHRTEHSLEFTAVFLAHALRHVRNRPIRALPILVGHLPEGADGSPRPADSGDARALVRALREIRRSREARGERVLFVAGVDLAHRGVRFGDPAVSETDLPALETRDRAFAGRVVTGDAAAATADCATDRGARRYCGFDPLWVLTSVLGACEGEVLSYGHDLSEGAVVTFFAGTMRQ